MRCSEKKAMLAGLVMLIFSVALLTGCGGVGRGTLEVRVVDPEGSPVAGAEVWVCEGQDLGESPGWVGESGQDGVVLFDLSAGLYAAGLSPQRYYASEEEAGKNVIHVQVREREAVERTLVFPQSIGLSEQPDSVTFRKYFSDMGIGGLPAGGELPYDLKRNVRVFAPGDQICLYGTIVQEVQVTTAIYDVKAKGFIGERQGFPQALSPGGFAGCSAIDIPVGRYEIKVYADDVLIAVIPFEVRSN